MTTSDQVRDAVDAVARFLVSEVRLGETLERIAALAKEAVGPTTALGVTLLDDDGRPATRVFTDDVSPAVDQAQYDEDAGPCLDAFREGRVLLVQDVAATVDRWPGFAREALRQGVVSSLSLPLTAGEERMGVMNLYATGGPFDEQSVSDGTAFATQAAVVLANCRAYWQAFDLSTTLQTALESRAVIDQAKGTLMAQRGCSAEEAFTMLVSASQRENVRLRDVARRIVDGTAVAQDDA